ncbi:hypothetical protein [Endozoicomonas lisbonensis]|uniref:Uncharacterized protein n=1 Tax=Endozoicomonas lisbonensis TaxID=3120522 RepID=A0ABV2SAV2_9GAMM
MKPLLKILSIPILVVMLLQLNSAKAGWSSPWMTSDGKGYSSVRVGLTVVGVLVVAAAGGIIGGTIASSNSKPDPTSPPDNTRSTSPESRIKEYKTLEDLSEPDDDYQKKIIKEMKLLPFKESEDNYSDTTASHYLWARATFLDNYDKFKDKIKPALFPFNSWYDAKSPSSACMSELPKPFKKESRCNDGHLTGFCLIKFEQNGKERTLVGLLANTSDNVSGCQLGWRDDLDYGRRLPRNALLTDKRYYQINVITPAQTYKFNKKPAKNITFASTVFYKGHIRHETLCREAGGPGTEWYLSNGERGADPCRELSAAPPDIDFGGYFVPHRRIAGEVDYPARVDWKETTTDHGSAVNDEVQANFCAPKKLFKEFILGSVGEHRFCRYINAKGNAGYVDKKPDGSVQSDFLRPSIKETVRWQTFKNAIPYNAIIAGLSYANAKIIKTERVYFCRYVDNYIYRYGQVIQNTDTCRSSLASVENIHSIDESKTFEVLVPAL